MRGTDRRRSRLAAAALCLACTAPCAQEAPGDAALPPPASGAVPEVSLRGHATGYVASGNRLLDDRRDIRGMRLGAELRLRADAASAYLEFDAEATRGNRRDDGRRAVREAYAAWRWSSGSMRVGRQVVAWGRADEFNPTDNVTPYHHARLALEPSQRRVGTGALVLNQALGDAATMQLVVVPAHAASTVPSERLLPPHATVEPDVSWRRPESGLRVDWSRPGLDLGLSAYGGRTRVGALKASAEGLFLVHPAVRVLGADFSATLGSWGFRGELALTRYGADADATGLGPNRYLVLGIERDIGQGTVIAQLLHRDANLPAMPGPGDPLGDLVAYNRLAAGLLSPHQTAVNLNWTARWAADRVQTWLSLLVGTRERDHAVRARVRWGLADDWNADLVAEVFRGPPGSLLGSQRDNSLLLASLSRSF